MKKLLLAFMFGLVLGLGCMFYNNYKIRVAAIVCIEGWRSLYFQSIEQNWRGIELLHIQLTKQPKAHGK